MDPSRDQQYDEFVALLGHSENRIRRFVRSLLIDASEIDDVMQDVSLECWRKFATFEPASDQSRYEEFIRWACVVARFKVLSRVRDSSRDRLVFRKELSELLADEATNWVSGESSRQIAFEGCLERLPSEDRCLLLNVHAPGGSVAEIARRTGGEARRLYRRVNKLREALLRCTQSKMAEA